MTLNLAILRLNGVSGPVSAAFVADELAGQLRALKPMLLFCTQPLLQTALQAAKVCGFPENKIFICDMPGADPAPEEFRSLAQLVRHGKSLPDLEAISWATERSSSQVAFVCSSSGTSGLPVRSSARSKGSAFL